MASDPPARRSSRADASHRPVSAADIRPVRGHRRLLVRGAGAGVRRAAILLPGNTAPDRGRDRAVHDALAAGGRDHGADRRPAVRPLSGRHPRRHRPGAALPRHGAAGDAAGGAHDRRYRLAHGAVRMRIWFLPGSEPEGADVERAAGPQRQRQQHRGDGASHRTNHWRGAGRILLQLRRPRRRRGGAGAGRGSRRDRQPDELSASDR